MITIGRRTRACNAMPGFSLLELKDECDRRGIPYSSHSSKEELVNALCVPNSRNLADEREEVGIPGLLFHRTFGVFNDDTYLRVVDLDSGVYFASWEQSNIRILGIDSQNKIVFCRRSEAPASYLPGTYFVNVKDILETKRGHLGMFGYELDLPVSRSPLPTGNFYPHKVVGNKLIYTQNGETPTLNSLDLVTFTESTLYKGIVDNLTFRGPYTLIETGAPRKIILIDIPKKKEIWRLKDSEVVTAFDYSLLDSRRFVAFGDPYTIFYTLIDDTMGGGAEHWEEFNTYHDNRSLGMSKGRVILSDSYTLFLYDISDPKDPKPKFLSLFPLDVAHSEAVENTQDKFFEFPDGRVIFYHHHRDTQFLFDAEAQTVDNRSDKREYFLLPVRPKERKKFADVIYSSARIPRAIAEVIEGFI